MRYMIVSHTVLSAVAPKDTPASSLNGATRREEVSARQVQDVHRPVQVSKSSKRFVHSAVARYR